MVQPGEFELQKKMKALLALGRERALGSSLVDCRRATEPGASGSIVLDHMATAHMCSGGLCVLLNFIYFCLLPSWIRRLSCCLSGEFEVTVFPIHLRKPFP